MSPFLKVFFCAAILAMASCQSAPIPKSSPAITQPVLIPIKYEGQERYQVIRAWDWSWRGHHEKAPLGVVVDGASVPRPAWFFMPPDGLHRAAALAHDMAYIHRGRMPSGWVLSRPEADAMFYDLMLQGGVGETRAKIAYAAVRVGGWVEWRRPYQGPVILPVQQPFTAKRKTPFVFGRHIYQ